MLRRLEAVVNVDQPIEWIVSESENGGTVFRWGYSGLDLVAEWEGLVTLRATRDGELKAIRYVPGIPEDLINKTRQGSVAAFLRAQRQLHTMHACAVSLEGRALMCVGASGMGKSTMAERLCRYPGVELLADDMAAIELLPGSGAQVRPSESAVWLATDGSEAKEPVKSTRMAARPGVLQGIVSLVFNDASSQLELLELRGADAVSALLPSFVRFERSAALWTREFDFVAHLVSHSKILRAIRSREIAAETVAEALLRFLAGEPQ